MAGSAVLERELKKQEEKITYEEQAREMPTAYDILRSQTAGNRTGSAVQENSAESGASAYSPAADRLNAYYQTPSAPARKKTLFDNYEYVNGELMQKNPETDEMTRAFGATVADRPVPQEPVGDLREEVQASAAAEVTAEPSVDDSDEDALPTRRTMESVIRSASVQEITVTDTRTGFKAALTSLSTKMKIVLLSVAAAILLAIVLICVNTSIIRSLDSDLTDLKGRATEQQTTYENLQKESNLYTDPNSEIVADWAQSNGMTK